MARRSRPAVLTTCGLLSLLLALLAVTSACVRPAFETGPRGAPAFDAPQVERAVHLEVNRARQRQGLAPLVWNEVLLPVAREHSREMARSGRFSHTNADGQDPTSRAREGGFTCRLEADGYRYEGVGENLFAAHRYRSYQTVHGPEGMARHYDWKSVDELARETVRAWLDSPGHRANLLQPRYRTQAIGAALADDQMVYLTQNFC